LSKLRSVNSGAWILPIAISIAAIFSYNFVDSLTQKTTARFGFRGDVKALFELIGFFGHGFFCVFVAASIWFLDRKNRKAIGLLVAAVLLAGGASDILKSQIVRARPAVVAGVPDKSTESVFGKKQMQSFPSGHTTTAFAMAASLAMIYPHGRIYFFTLAVLVAFQRVLTQAHYPSDVLVGAAFGMLGAQASAVLLRDRVWKFLADKDSLPQGSEPRPGSRPAA
jgi:membrane-associated phospholipid phosphatase